jgi:hypothetical protein
MSGIKKSRLAGLMYELALVIFEINPDNPEPQATLNIQDFRTLEEASEGMNNVASVIATIFSMEPGESFTVFSDSLENKTGDPPNSLGAGAEKSPVF